MMLHTSTWAGFWTWSRIPRPPCSIVPPNWWTFNKMLFSQECSGFGHWGWRIIYAKFDSGTFVFWKLGFSLKNPVEKIFLSRSKIFFRGRKFPKIFQRKINENRKFWKSQFSISIDFPLEIFRPRKYFWPRQKYFFDRKFLMKIHIFFYKSSQNLIWNK